MTTFDINDVNGGQKDFQKKNILEMLKYNINNGEYAKVKAHLEDKNWYQVLRGVKNT